MINYRQLAQSLQKGRPELYIPAPNRYTHWMDILDSWWDTYQNNPTNESPFFTVYYDTEEEGIRSQLTFQELPIEIQAAIMYFTLEIALSCMLTKGEDTPWAPPLLSDTQIANLAERELLQSAFYNLPGIAFQHPVEVLKAYELYQQITMRLQRTHTADNSQHLFITLQTLIQLLYVLAAPMPSIEHLPALQSDVQQSLENRQPTVIPTNKTQLSNIFQNIINRCLVYLARCSPQRRKTSHQTQRGPIQGQVHPSTWPLLSERLNNRRPFVMWEPRELAGESRYGEELTYLESFTALQETIRNLYSNWWFLIEQKLSFRL